MKIESGVTKTKLILPLYREASSPQEAKKSPQGPY